MKIRYLFVALLAVSLVAVPAMAQDDCGTAVPPGSITDPCNDSTPTGPVGSCSSYPGTLDVWYSFVATDVSARLRTDLNSVGSDSNFGVYSSSDNTCGGTLTEIGCSEDEVGYLGDISITNLNPGDTYFVQLGVWADGYYACFGDGPPDTGTYVLDVIMPSDAAEICGDNVINQFGEVCDGTDDVQCPTLCQQDCTCPDPVCGNNVAEPSGNEECDGTDDANCVVGCDQFCACIPLDTPALPIGGIVGLGLLLVGGGAVAFRRHRKSA